MSTLFYTLLLLLQQAARGYYLPPINNRLSSGRPPGPTTVAPFAVEQQQRHDSNLNMEDEQAFRAWLTGELTGEPGSDVYPEVFRDAIEAVVRWRRRFQGNPKLWQRLFKRDRVVKELVESAPIIAAVKVIVAETPLAAGEKVTIVDLASGKGFLSMFLSEILPPERVEKSVLVDKAWPRCGASAAAPHQINWEHIYGSSDGGHKYFDTWPIPLHTSKQDLKSGATRRRMSDVIFGRANGPVIVLAVHLCGTLSLRAVDLFNDHPESVKFLALKPCCLPGMVHAKRGDVFRVGAHSFPAAEVCAAGRWGKRGAWDGPPRWHLEGRFHRWAEHLEAGINVVEQHSEGLGGGGGGGGGVSDDSTGAGASSGSSAGRKRRDVLEIQVDGGFQNAFLFAERGPHLTETLWQSLERTAAMNQVKVKQRRTGAVGDDDEGADVEIEAAVAAAAAKLIVRRRQSQDKGSVI